MRTPHARHGNAGQTSHSAKTTTHEQFIKFVECNADPDDIRKVQDELTRLKGLHERHTNEAQQAHKYYVEVTTHCTSEWQIQKLKEKATLSDDEKGKLAALKNRFNLVLCAECKLIPRVHRAG